MSGVSRIQCAVEAQAEPLAGTAATDHIHLLLEHPGPWGHKAWEESDLPGDVRDTVAVRANAAGVRLHLIRRHGRTARPTGPQLFVAHTRPGAAWLQRTDLDDVRRLLDLDLEALAAGTPPGWGEVTDPMVLVCTNGRRDACCASLGRPVAKALADAHPDLTWESSHLGGHRFAAAVLMLPTGLAYGRLDADSALEVVDRALRGRLHPSHLRGRGSYAHPVQAAEVALLTALHETRVDALEFVGTAAAGESHRVTFRHGTQQHTLLLEQRPGVPARTSCTDAAPKPSTSWVATVETVRP